MGWDLSSADVSYIALQIPYGKSSANNLVNLGTREFINYAHKNDIAVQYWTINEPEDAELLVRNGADCIMSDYPQMVYEAVKSSK
jgi:glycerophosphoryl diester phosphodiesterase